jgi:hypothetical protein
MAITFPDNLFIGAGNPIDAKYLNQLNQPYSGVSAVIARIPEAQRYIGLTVNVNNVEYWFTGSTSDSCLVIKTAGGGGGTGTITGGTNGLGVSGKNVCLGGTITTPVVFTDNTGQGLQYAANYSGTFIDRSLVDKEYVDNKFSGTTYHIPVYNALGDGIENSTLAFSGTTLCNSDNLTIEVAASKDIFLVGKTPASNQNSITLGRPTLPTGNTIQHICVAGQATDINLWLNSKGTGAGSFIYLNTPVVYLGSNTQAGLAYDRVGHVLTMPDWGVICGYGGTSLVPDATPMSICGGTGFNNGDGGDVVIEAGLGAGTGVTGNVKICNLPIKTTETCVVYIGLNGCLSYGLASGGTGTIGITGATNGVCKYDSNNVCLGGLLNAPVQLSVGGGNTAGIEYFADYSAGFTSRSLIDKGYAIKLNEKVSKFITASFSVGDVIGYSGGTYNKAIADGTYNGEILGLVTAICGACVELTTAGYTTGLSGLVNDKTYFLSDVTAGLLTVTEPTTYGHISKAVLIADTPTSGWILPYAGYVVSTGGTDTNEGERITKLITYPLHPFSVGDVVGWSGTGYTKAIANGAYNGEVIGLVNKVVDYNSFELTQAGYIEGLTGITPTLSGNTTYFLSDSIAGRLTTTKPTTLTHVVRPVFASTTTTAGWVLPYPGYVLISGSSSYTATTVAAGVGLTDVAQTFNVNVTDIAPTGTEIPVKIDTGGSNVLYIDSDDISGGTTYNFIESGATQIYDDGFGNVTIYSPYPTGGTGSTVVLIGSGATQVNNISGSTWVIYSPTGGTGSYNFYGSGATQVSVSGNNVTVNTPIDYALLSGSTNPVANSAITSVINLILGVIAVPPTYVPPAVSLSAGITQTIEMGTTLGSFAANITFTQNDAGSATGYQLCRNASLISTGATNTITGETNITSAISYVGKTSYACGPTKNNNIGIPDPTGKILAGTVSSTRTITPVLRQFWGNAASVPTTSADVRALGSCNFCGTNTFSLTTGTINCVFAFAVPNTKSKVSVIDVGNLGADITACYALCGGGSFNVNDIGGNPHNYNVYVMQTAVPYPTSTTHAITVS